MKHIVVFMTMVLLFTSCSTRGNAHLEQYNASESDIVKALMAHYQQWRGARYRLGGMSKRGVDCSGFVYMAYKKRFNLELPRNTVNQIRAGVKVSKSNLRAGDLVFFKTSPGVRHVGIYVDRGRFMHASSSKGVTISKLNNPYWSKRYWFSKHIPELD
jgi:cell wall-associated NlpC family hydrolase